MHSIDFVYNKTRKIDTFTPIVHVEFLLSLIAVNTQMFVEDILNCFEEI